jgi:cyclophilin family peptidyl-prolyl cis-trans isomerase
MMNKYFYIGITILVLIFLLLGFSRVASFKEVEKEDVTSPINQTDNQSDNKINNNQENNMTTATLKTSKGDIKIEFYENDAPNTVNNFVSLAEKGFYNGVIFHRVIKGFMIQGGDPTGTGSGGPGYQFADELNPDTESYKIGYTRGTVAMANAGPNTNGSQFFIMHTDYALPHNYTIFGKVISGMEVVDMIAESPTAPGDRPIEEIKINEVIVD